MTIDNIIKYVRNGLTVAVLGAAIVTSPGCASKPLPPLTVPIDQLSLEQKIPYLMERGDVESILKEEYDSGLIQQIKYDKAKEETNFDELVYQKNVPADERMPVFVFFWNGQPTRNYELSPRSAIITKELAKEYEGKIKFVSYEVHENPKLDWNNSKTKFPEKHGVNLTPSYGLYSQWDLLKGETPEKNDGEIKQIDIQRDGPEANRNMQAHFENISYYWIRTNIFLKKNPEDNTIARYENTYQIHPVGDLTPFMK